MTQKEKRLQKFLENPTSCSYSDIERILIHLDFVRVEAKGSHVKFTHHHTNKSLIFSVHHHDCKDIYKKMAKKIIVRHIL